LAHYSGMAIQHDIETLKALYDEGRSLRDVAALVGLGSNTVKRKLLAHGVVLRDKNQSDKDKNNWWQNYKYLYEAYVHQEQSTTDIGKVVNASSRTVHTWLTKLNIPTRPTGGAYKKGTTMSVESRRKMSAAKSGKYTGSSNPNWRGAQVTDAVRERRSYDAKVWREACLKRDNFKCTSCGSSEKLHVHHILEFADYPARRWDINNGKTVCVFCHEKIHKRTFPDWLTERERVESTKPAFVAKQEQKPFTIEQSVLLWLYESNSTAAIGKMFGFNDETVRKKLHQCRIKRRNVGGVKIAVPSKEQLQAVYPKLSIKDAGRHFNVGQTLMLKWLNVHGIPTTKKHRHR
jgi:5-methylcytosine-specific restriction endonuclease McrA/predicted transcriptional regulator